MDFVICDFVCGSHIPDFGTQSYCPKTGVIAAGRMIVRRDCFAQWHTDLAVDLSTAIRAGARADSVETLDHGSGECALPAEPARDVSPANCPQPAVHDFSIASRIQRLESLRWPAILPEQMTSSRCLKSIGNCRACNFR